MTFLQRYTHYVFSDLTGFQNLSGLPHHRFFYSKKNFKKLPSITSYHHFTIDKNEPGIVVVKQTIDGEESKHNILKKTFPYGPNKIPRYPRKLKPSGISIERAWYLYDNIRKHIPNEEDKNSTCPKPKRPKP
jgi:hypothetical protein